MNNKIRTLFGVILIILVGWFMFSSFETEQERPIKIGVILPLSGKLSAWGEASQRGAELAKEEMIASGKSLEIVYEDYQSEVAKGVSAYQKLVNIDQVDGIITISSSLTDALLPLIEETQVPVVVSAVGLTDATKKSDYLFRIWPSGKAKASSMGDGLKDRADSKIAIITANNESTLDLLEQLKENVFSELNIDIVFEEVVDRKEQDFKTSLLKIKQEEFDSVLINLYTGQVGLAIKQARELGVDGEIISNNMGESNSEIESSQGAMEGVWMPGAPVPSVSFMEKYREAYGDLDLKTAPAIYDGVSMLTLAIEQSLKNETEAKEELLKIDDYFGAHGGIKFDENGDIELVVPLKKVENGELVDY